MMATVVNKKKVRALTMSKYTTEVRYICEKAAGLDKSVGYDDVNNVVQTAYPKIFDSSLEFYNEETKTRLLPKILIHYYQREIGFETVGLWKLKLNQKMREILPYYNQLYASEDLKYNPLTNVDNAHTHEGDYINNKKGNKVEVNDKTETRNLTTTDDGISSFDRNEDTLLKHSKTTEHDDNKTIHAQDKTIHGNDVTTRSIDSARDRWVMFSDTPQGGINGVQLAGGVSQNGTLSDNAYLTNATHETENPAATHDTVTYGDVTRQFGDITNQIGDITETYNKGNNTNKDHVDTDGWDKVDNTNKQTGTIDHTGKVTNVNESNDTGKDTYLKTETGKIGVETYQEMVIKYRKTFLNIDMNIINELDDLFMKVW